MMPALESPEVNDVRENINDKIDAHKAEERNKPERLASLDSSI